MQNVVYTIGFQERDKYFAKMWRKSPNIAIVTLRPCALFKNILAFSHIHKQKMETE
jgi:hypothetical protein